MTVPRRQIPAVTRWLVMVRDRWTCQHCGATDSDSDSTDLQIDHIVPWANCGPDDPDDFDNLQVLCRRCNLRKGNRTVG